MTEAAGRLAVAGAWDLHRVAAAVGETVWWVTLVDATLVRYHPRDYERALAGREVRRRKTEGTLAGLRYVRNQLGKYRAYQERLAERDIARTFDRCAEFLAQAASLVGRSSSPPR